MSPMLDNSDPVVSDYAQSFKHNADDQPHNTTEPLFPWNNLQHSADFGQEAFAPSGKAYSFSELPTSSRVPEVRTTSRQDSWKYDSPQGSISPHSSSTFQQRHPFDLNHGFPECVNGHPFIQRPLLPLPMRQRPCWTDSTVADTMNEMLMSEPLHSQSFPYDAANQIAPCLYSTSSDRPSSLEQDMMLVHRDFSEDMTAEGCETDSESRDGNQPYAKLIYQALMDAPEHRLVLRDIYAWIAQNTDKAKNPINKGWQNSVRHNLSMNGSFKKVDLIDPNNKSKKGFIWVLEPSAVGHGIQSTTRYRPKPGKKNDHTDGVDLKRQRAGKSGGKAARRSGRNRSLTRLEDPRISHYVQSARHDLACPTSAHFSNQLTPNMDLNGPANLPYYSLPTPPLSTRSPLPGNASYDYDDDRGRPETQPHDFMLNDAFEHDLGANFTSNLRDSGYEDHFFGNSLTCLP